MAKRYHKIFWAGLIFADLLTLMTLVVILRSRTWHYHLVRFLYRSWAAFLVVVGSTGPGFTSPVVVAVLSALLSIGLMGWLQGSTVFRQNVWENALMTLIVPTTVLVFVYGPQFLWVAASTGYKDHRDLVTMSSHLQKFAANEKQFRRELAEAKAKANNWRDAYIGISKGERVPDRILNDEETDKMHAELLQVATATRHAKRAESLKIEINPAFYEDRESTHLALQLFSVFKGSAWDAKWPTVHSKAMIAFFYAHYPVGVTIYTDDRNNRGDWLMWTMKDAGINATVAQEMIPGFQGTLICVGNKQFP